MKTLDEIIKNTPIYWDDLYPKLNEWAKTIAIEYANSLPPQPSATAAIKKIAVDFFYYWWNVQGSNTEQGFDDWWKLYGEDYAQQTRGAADGSISIERAKKYAAHQHYRGTINEPLVEFEDWAAKD